MHVSAKADYALRALTVIAARHPAPVTMQQIVATQSLPRSFAETILPGLRRAGFLRVFRSGRPSYLLARSPDQISVASVLLAVDGPLTRVRGLTPEALTYSGAAQRLGPLWLLATDRLRTLLDAVTLQDLVNESADTLGVWAAESAPT